MIKLNLGAGDSKIEGFTSVDLYDEVADIQADVCELPFKDNSVVEGVAYQVIEHIPYNRSIEMFREWYRVLKPGGHIMIETPDIDVICAKILTDGLSDLMMYSLVGEYYRPWDTARYKDWDMCAAAIHRNPWNFDRLAYIAGGAGFTVERTEPTQIIAEENMACRLSKLA